MTKPITQAEFGGMLERAGLTLTEAQTTELFRVYPMLQTMIVRATAPMPREAEPALTFTSEVK